MEANKQKWKQLLVNQYNIDDSRKRKKKQFK